MINKQSYVVNIVEVFDKINNMFIITLIFISQNIYIFI